MSQLLRSLISVVFKITDNDRDVEITGQQQWPRSVLPARLFLRLNHLSSGLRLDHAGSWAGGNLCMVSSNQRSANAALGRIMLPYSLNVVTGGECKIQFPPQKSEYKLMLSGLWCQSGGYPGGPARVTGPGQAGPGSVSE